MAEIEKKFQRWVLDFKNNEKLNKISTEILCKLLWLTIPLIHITNFWYTLFNEIENLVRLMIEIEKSNRFVLQFITIMQF